MFKITIQPEEVSKGIVASGTHKVKGSSVSYEWEVEAFDNGKYQLIINGDYEADFNSVKACKDYVKRLADSTAADIQTAL